MGDTSTPQMHSTSTPPILAHFLRQIQNSHVRTPTSKPFPLHYDSETKSLREFRWPFDAETGRRIPPSMLESFRRTHHFRGPSCLCAFLDDQDYSEAAIGIVEMARGEPDGSHDSVMNGQYVAACANQRCGYYLCMEMFYMRDGISLMACLRRETPLPPQELNHISDLQGLGISATQPSGLSQIVSEPPVYHHRRSMRLTQKKPELPQRVQELLMKRLINGMTEATFWRTFVQCFACKDVMLRQGAFSYHRCRFQSERAPPRSRSHPYARTTEPSVDEKMAAWRSRLNRNRGDALGIPDDNATEGHAHNYGLGHSGSEGAGR